MARPQHTQTIEIHHPQAPEYMIRIEMADFNPAIHKVWVAPEDTTEIEVDDADPESEAIGDPEPAPIQRPPTIDEIRMLGWKAIKAYATEHGYPAKPEGTSWEDYLIAILYGTEE